MTNTADAYWRTLGLAAPARRAIIAADITHLADLTAWRANDLAQLHGIGAHAMSRLRSVLAEHHLSFADENMSPLNASPLQDLPVPD